MISGALMTMSGPDRCRLAQPIVLPRGPQLDFARPVRSPLRQRPAAIPRRISDLARGCYDVFPAAAGIRILRVDRQPPWKARSRTLAQVNQRLTAPSAERHVQSRGQEG